MANPSPLSAQATVRAAPASAASDQGAAIDAPPGARLKGARRGQLPEPAELGLNTVPTKSPVPRFAWPSRAKNGPF